MPPLPAISGAVKLSLFYDDNGANGPVCRAANILHLWYGAGTVLTFTQLATVANAAGTWWTSHFKPSVQNQWRLTKVSALMLDGSGTQSDSTFAPIVGGTVGLSLPPQASVAVSWLGAPAVRGGRPRTYLPGIPQAAASSGGAVINSSYATTLRSAAQAAISDMAPFIISSTTPALGYVSYFNKLVNPTPPHLRPTPLFFAFTGCKVHQRLDSQRRRSGKEANYSFV